MMPIEPRGTCPRGVVGQFWCRLGLRKQARRKRQVTLGMILEMDGHAIGRGQDDRHLRRTFELPLPPRNPRDMRADGIMRPGQRRHRNTAPDSRRRQVDMARDDLADVGVAAQHGQVVAAFSRMISSTGMDSGLAW